ncbi:MAG: apolipoprotein N-acyltransferase [Armatimonadota bacterium]
MRKRNLFLAIISGILLALSMPRPGIWPLAWVGLVPLLAAIRGARGRTAAFYGLVTGLIYFGVIVFWITIFGYLPWALVTLKETLFFAAFAALASRVTPERTGRLGYIAVPAAWTTMQWVRSLGALGFTWGSFAHTQASNTPVIQLASLAGPWIIDFVVCLVNVALAESVIATGRKRLCAGATAILVALGAWLAGFAILNSAPEPHPTTKVAVIQGNVAQDVVPDLNYLADTYIAYSKMSRRAADCGAKLIIWPETTLPTEISDANWAPILSGLAEETEATYIVGGYAPSSDRSNPLYHNSALFYGSDGAALGTYHKVRLVPYGEYVPLREQMPFLNRYGIREQDVLPGKSHNLIRTDLGKLGVSICFESLFPQISRVETKNGARLLVVVTNDGWFDRSAAAEQHLMMSRLRAVENRRFVVRGAATGISAVVDPYGRTVSELGVFKRGIVSARIEPLATLTPYTRTGDWLAYACAIVSATAVAFDARRKRKR